jgi:ribose-phosphate pyrophosphokinase
MSGTAGPPALVIGFPEYQAPAERLASAAGLPFAPIVLHRFPDGETRVRLPETLPAHCIFCRSLDRPNGKLVELCLAAAGARALGARKLTLVAPYLCYMRQDTAFNPGEVVSQQIIGALLARYFDAVLTVDAHLHRVHELSQAVPVQSAVNLTAAPLMAEFLNERIEAPYLLGPDMESLQWVNAIAATHNFDHGVARKQRHGDREVSVQLPDLPDTGRNFVLIDDVASTGRTLLEATRALSEYRPASISVLVTHALFVEGADAQLLEAGVSNLWSCDSIPHTSNRIELAGLFAGSLPPANLPPANLPPANLPPVK